MRNAQQRVDLFARVVALDSLFAQTCASYARSLIGLTTWDQKLDMAPFLNPGIEAAERSLALDSTNMQAVIPGVLERRLATHRTWVSRANDLAAELVKEDPDDSFNILIQALYYEALGRYAEALH